MATKARAAMEVENLKVVADRGYYNSKEILACRQAGMDAVIPKAPTSGAKADGRFDRADFVYDAATNEYRCPAGQRLTRRFARVERGLTLHRYWSSHCPQCDIKDQCTPSDYRRVTRWEHESVLEAMQARLDRAPEYMRLRRQTAEHPFATIKAWMGSTHFLTRGLNRVRTEMSLHVLAGNLKRVMNLLGTRTLIEAMRT